MAAHPEYLSSRLSSETLPSLPACVDGVQEENYEMQKETTTMILQKPFSMSTSNSEGRRVPEMPCQEKGKEFEDFKSIHELCEFIKNPENTVPIYPLLIPVTGLPNTGHTQSIERAFHLESTEENSPGNFSHHEFVASWFEQEKMVNTKEDVSFMLGLESGMLFNCKEWSLPSVNPYSRDGLDSMSFGENCNIAYMNNFSSHLQSRAPVTPRDITEVQEEYESQQESDSVFHEQNSTRQVKNSYSEVNREISRMLLHGAGFLNMWNVSINNKSVRPILESFGRYFTRSILWLFVDLDEDPSNLYLPPCGTDSDPKALSLQSRMQYLLRQCQLCRYSKYSKSQEKKVCSIFATYSFSKTKNLTERVRSLQIIFEEAARQMGIYKLIDFNITLVNKDDDKAKPLQIKVNEAFNQVEHQKVPLCWLFLRGALSLHKEFCIEQDELEKMATDCGIPKDGDCNLHAFCDFFSSFGSILDPRKLDEKSTYVVIKPQQFLSCCDEILKTMENHECGIVDTQHIRSQDDRMAIEIMASIGIAVNISSVCTTKLYIPTLRREDRKKYIFQDSIQFVLGVGSPNIRKNTGIIKILRECLCNVRVRPSRSQWSNCIVLTATTKANSREVVIFMSFQGDVTEVLIENIATILDDELDVFVEKVVTAFHKMVEEKATNLSGIRYHFAVKCMKNPDDSIAYYTYHKRHVLPLPLNEEFCDECIKHGIGTNRLVSACNKALKKVDVPKDLKLNGDLDPHDTRNLIEELSEYPIEAIEMLSKELGVEDYFNKHKLEGKMWLVMGMLLKWQRHLDKKDESPKKVLARHLVAVDVEWKKRKEPDFGRLAQMIDMQVLTKHQKEMLEQ